MTNAFKDRATFNEDISGWDVSLFTTMVREACFMELLCSTNLLEVGMYHRSQICSQCLNLLMPLNNRFVIGTLLRLTFMARIFLLIIFQSRDSKLGHPKFNGVEFMFAGAKKFFQNGKIYDIIDYKHELHV